MENKGFKVSQYACAVLLIVSSIALVAYQVIEIDDVATGLLYYVAQSFLLAGSIFGLDHYIKIINKNYHERNSKWRSPLPAISFGSITTINVNKPPTFPFQRLFLMSNLFAYIPMPARN